MGQERRRAGPHLLLRVLKPLVFVLCLVPLGVLLWWGSQGRLGANPVEYVIHYNGDWALRFLLITLAVTPLRRLTGWNRLASYRRMLGLYAFFYACLHLLTYSVIDQFFDFHVILTDILKRKYITVGMAAFTILLALAATSTSRAVVRLGPKRWQALHRWVYIAGLLGAVHYWMSVKKDIRLPMMYLAILGVLMLFRLAVSWRQRTPVRGSGQDPP